MIWNQFPTMFSASFVGQVGQIVTTSVRVVGKGEDGENDDDEERNQDHQDQRPVFSANWIARRFRS